MARSASAKKNKSFQIPYLSESLQIFIARRLVDVMAFAFAVAGLFLLLSFFSYTPDDPSWNSSGQTDTLANWMGISGAYAADLFLQTMGMASILPALVFLIWGYRLYKRQSLSIFALRVLALLGLCLSAPLAIALIPSQDILLHPYMGGAAGTLMMGRIIDALSQLHFLSSFGAITVSIVSAIVGVFCFVYAGAYTKSDVQKFALICWLAVKTAILFVLVAAQKFMAWVKHYNGSKYEPEAREKPIFQWPKLDLSGLLHSDSADTSARKPAKKTPIEAPQAAPNKPDSAAATPALQHAPQHAAEPAQSQRSGAAIPVVASSETSSPTSKGHQDSNAQARFALQDGEWEFPPITLLEEVPETNAGPQLNEEALRKNAELLQNVLNDFKIEGDIVSIHPGPVVTLYELEPAPGTKSSRIISLADDIARSMSAISVRCAVVPGRNVIGIELPNKKRQFVYMRELVTSSHYTKTKAHLPLILGKDIGGQPILADLAKMPHLLVAGTTGSGKSVAVNTMILSLLYALPPEKCRFIMIDPKMLELSVYDDIPHLLSPVVTEPGKAVVALKWTVAEMEERYRAMSKLGVRNIEGYNERLREAKKKGETIMNKVQTGFEPDTGKPIFEEQEMDLTELPYIVVVVDEFADLMLVAGKDVENAIQRLAQMARAAGIHLIMATQRPSVDVITGVIKANFPTRISFQVTSKVDSRTILGDSGAEQLLGMGDMLYMAPGGRIKRVHGPFVSDSDVEDVVNHLKAQASPSYIHNITDESDLGSASEIMNAIFDDRNGGESKVDELYDKAVAIVASEGKVSTSFIQRHLQIGYNRAARIVEEMEKQGIISKASPTGKREILVQDWGEV